MKSCMKQTIGNNPQIRDEKDSVVSIPQDLIIEILAKLPTRSLAKLMVVSKLWSSIIRSRYFKDLCVTRSLTSPCFLFTYNRENSRFFHLVSEEAPSSSDHHITCFTPSPTLRSDVSPPTRGLICCQNDAKVAISNPSTGQFVVLPKVNTGGTRLVLSFLGYDSIKDEYKVLCMTVSQTLYSNERLVSAEHQVFTLGAQNEEATWRMVECKLLPHCPVTQGRCSNGFIYYGALTNISRQASLFVAFDVRLEEFSLVKLPDGVVINPTYCELVNYKKKVALVNQSFKAQVELWVLEDVDRQEWSKIFVLVPCWNDFVGTDLFYCRGATSSGEFIFAPFIWTGPSAIIIYDRKQDIARKVEIKGIGGKSSCATVFLDHIECPVFL